MAENLVEMLQTALSATFAGDVATHLGESSVITRSALGAAGPALLAGLLQRGAAPGGMAELYERITGSQVDAGLTSHVGSWLGGGDKTASLLSQGSALVSWLFGNKTGAVAEAISSGSGMKIGSVTTLLSVAAPAVFALLKRHLAQNRLDAGGFAGLLAGQRDNLRAQLDDRFTGALGFASPAAFLASVASGLTGPAAAAAGRGVDTARDIGRGVAQTAGAAHAVAGDTFAREPAVPIVRRPWFWGALAAAAVVLIALFSYWTTPLERTAQTAQNPAGTVSRAAKSVDLPGGMKINVTTGGFLDSLTAFLGNKGVTTGRSFTFDELQFEPGSATLSPVSTDQLDQLAAVLKAYGSVFVNVAGHTDNTGDPVANRRLSAERAATVKQALAAQGVPASRVTDEGYGSEKPIASNDTEEGRAKNRRVELVVLKR